MTEQWRPVVGYEGYYEVSNEGRVRALERFIVNGGHRQRRAPKGRKTYLNRNGYPSVKLSRDGVGRTRPVHALMAEAFLDRPAGATQVRHLNGVRADCRLENLAWGTQSDNQRDAMRHGTAHLMPQAVCIRGHALAGPNLVMPHRADVGRRCLACDRARTQVRDARRRGVHLDMDALADQHYAQIMETAA